MHDFITANYGSALRNAKESAVASSAKGVPNLKSMGLAVMFANSPPLGGGSGSPPKDGSSPTPEDDASR